MAKGGQKKGGNKKKAKPKHKNDPPKSEPEVQEQAPKQAPKEKPIMDMVPVGVTGTAMITPILTDTLTHVETFPKACHESMHSPETWEPILSNLNSALFVDTFQAIMAAPSYQVAAAHKEPALSHVIKDIKNAIEQKWLHPSQPSKAMLDRAVSQCPTLNRLPNVTFPKEMHDRCKSLLETKKARVIQMAPFWNDDMDQEIVTWDEDLHYRRDRDKIIHDDWVQISSKYQPGIPLGRIRVGQWSPDHDYEGQTRLKYDPATSLFHFYFCVEKAEQLNAQTANRGAKGEEEVEKILDQLVQKFKAGRFMRWDVKVKDIKGMIYYELKDDMSLLVFDTNVSPPIYTRRVCVTAEERCSWRLRRDFTPGEQISTQGRYFIMAETIEIERMITAMMQAEGEAFKSMYLRGIPDLHSATGPTFPAKTVRSFQTRVHCDTIPVLHSYLLCDANFTPTEDIDYEELRPHLIESLRDDTCFKRLLIETTQQVKAVLSFPPDVTGKPQMEGMKSYGEVIQKLGTSVGNFKFSFDQVEFIEDQHHIDGEEMCSAKPKPSDHICTHCNHPVPSTELFCNNCGVLKEQKDLPRNKKPAVRPTISCYFGSESKFNGSGPLAAMDYDSEEDIIDVTYDQRFIRTVEWGELPASNTVSRIR
ncbi:hypothetical protein PROFUN_09163 [Planoprotostelium fungivorum]|uniref:Uncharacterized protein n=1 Tax=Planoprotostelium fungivorum TaxID=1890364 RepID=A0A2P6MVK8_9EUKA|nr:hypothetical protein PROFUN_09163 [Planoprotostelium fungivorum]